MLQNDEVTALVKRMRLVWFAMMASVSLYAGVVWILIQRGVRFPAYPPMMLSYAAVLALLLLPAATFARKRIDAAPRGASAREISRRWQTGWIVGQALREASGLFGATMGLLFGASAWVVGFACASLAAIVMSPPWEADIRLRLRGTENDPE